MSELFYPEQTSTGYFLTEIARGLAQDSEVYVLCGQPSYSERGTVAPWNELWNGIKIKRLKSTHFNKDNILLRFLNAITFTLLCFFHVFFLVKKADNLLIVTNPPMLYPLVVLLCRLKGVHSILLVHDVYPDVLHATGMLRMQSLVYRGLECFFSIPMRLADDIVVLGRDMQFLIAAKAQRSADDIHIIPNWGDSDEIYPLPRANSPFAEKTGITSHTIIQFSGNIGRTHDVETILESARLSLSNKNIRFMFIGYGAGTDRVLASIAADRTSNVELLPRQPREMLGSMLSSATAVVISFNDNMLGLSVPSRMYNVMAAGTPIIAMAHPMSELSQLVIEQDCGWVIPQGDAAALAGLAAWLDTEEGQAERNRKGRNARECVVERYTFQKILRMYKQLIKLDKPRSLD